MITLRLLGPPELTQDGQDAPPELRWRKHHALLAYLHCQGRRGAPRATLLDLLWGDKPEASARHSLNEALRVIRRAVGDDALASQGDRVVLLAGATSDVERVTAALAAGAEPEVSDLGGEFMAGFEVAGADPFEDWLQAMRLEWRRRCADLLARAAERRLSEGDTVGAAALAARALELDPRAEPVVEVAMRANALRGDRAGAIEAWERYRTAVADVGATPVARLQRLAERVRATRPAPVPVRDDGSRRLPLVGREAALAPLLGCWAMARDGRASVGLVRGDPGTGRSRMLEELAERARLDGATLLRLRAVPADRADPGGGLRALAATDLLQAPGIAAAAPAALSGMAAHLPAWAERFPAAAAPPLPLRQAMVEMLRATVQDAPLLLVVDDAQWLDEESLEVLLALPRDLPRHPLMVVVAAWRAPSPAAVDQAAALLGRDLPGAAVRLDPLPEPELVRLVMAVFPAYDDSAAHRLARRIATDSAGLPLLAVELLHAIAGGLELAEAQPPWPSPDRTLDQTMPGSLPDAVVAAIRLGFRRLGDPARRLLVALAVLGDRESAERLGQAADLAPGERDQGLDELEWQQWVRVEARGYLYVARVARAVVARDLVTAGQRSRILARIAPP